MYTRQYVCVCRVPDWRRGLCLHLKDPLGGRDSGLVEVTVLEG